MATIQGAGAVSPTLTDGTNQSVISQVNAILQNASAIGMSVTGGGNAPAPTTYPPELIVDTRAGSAIASGGFVRAPSYQYFVVGDTNAPIQVFGGGLANQGVILGQGPIAFYSGGGSGTVVGGDGGKTVDIGTGGNNFAVYTGSGDDNISLLNSAAAGKSTVQAGVGNNTISLGAQPTAIRSVGQDTIAVSTGSTTVQAIGNAQIVVSGGSGSRTVLTGTASSTVSGGTGSATVIGGSGGGQFSGGAGGNNLLIGGNGPASASGTVFLTGAGDGDVLIATSTNAISVLQAGTGNETLLGSLSTMDNTFAARSANALIIGGSGNDTIIAGSGASTLTGGAGFDSFRFNAAGPHGGPVVITDFIPGLDRVSLVGYGDAPANLAASAQRVAGNSSRIVLSDGTSITFLGLTSVNASYFG